MTTRKKAAVKVDDAVPTVNATSLPEPESDKYVVRFYGYASSPQQDYDDEDCYPTLDRAKQAARSYTLDDDGAMARIFEINHILTVIK
jgi:hypothetical protein